MKADKKIELYQYYKKLENKLENNKIKIGIYKFFLGIILFVVFTSGILSIPLLPSYGWFNQNNFEKAVCQLDSIVTVSYGQSKTTSYFTYLTRRKDSKLSLEERKDRIVSFGGYYDFYTYLGKEPDTIPMSESLILDSIPLWVNKNNGYPLLIQKESIDKIDFTKYREMKLLIVFIFSIPILVLSILYIKKIEKQKMKLQREIIKAKHQWQNYTSD